MPIFPFSDAWAHIQEIQAKQKTEWNIAQERKNPCIFCRFFYTFAAVHLNKEKQMHRIASYSRKVMLRFRRWSRKEYAAFVSLHRHVTIGQVGRGIADASLGKRRCAKGRRLRLHHGISSRRRMYSLEAEDRDLEEIYSR